MKRTSNFQTLLNRARLQLEEGQSDDALFTIKTLPVTTKEHQRQADYLLGWYYVQRRKWEEAVQVLAPLCTPRDIEEKKDQSAFEEEHRASSLLFLGFAATNLSHYDDARRHFSECLKVLHRRRTPPPPLKIKALYSLGMTCVMRGLFTDAFEHYHAARDLCLAEGDNVNWVDLAHIYHGLCDAYREINKYMDAYIAGKEALKLYEQENEHAFAGRVHNLLGRISFLLGYEEEAFEHYVHSLVIASNEPSLVMVMVNCIALAELRAGQGRLEEAERYCQLARDHIDTLEDAHMCGVAYSISGKVAGALARQTTGSQQQQLFTNALRWFERAEKQFSSTQAHSDMADMYGWWAEVLEDAGQAQAALTRWKLSCTAMNAGQAL